MSNFSNGEDSSQVGGDFLFSADISSHFVGLEGEVSPLHHVADGSQIVHEFELVLKSLVPDAALVDVLQEVDTEKITKAGSYVLALDHIVGTAVSSP